MSDKAVDFVKRNARRLFELWFYAEIVSEDLKFQTEPQETFNSLDEEEDQSYKEVVAQLSETYGIEIVVEEPSDYARHDPLESSMRLGAAAVLSCELGTYTPSVIMKSQLKKVTLCGGIKGAQPGCAGLAFPVAGEIIIEIAPSKADWRMRRLAVHHEIFHHIDYFDDVLQYIDPWWESLNETGFAYSQEHHKLGASIRPGFVSSYAMTAVHEDKAELYCHMIVEFKRLEQLTQTDSVLRQKTQRMKDLLRQFSPEFDKSFWQKRLNAKPISRHSCGL